MKRLFAVLALVGLVLLYGSVSGAGEPVATCGLNPEKATKAIVAIRDCLPRGWETVDITWEIMPAGWDGAPECVLIRCEDTQVRIRHETEGFTYHPFYKIWILPCGWEGRMEVAAIGPDATQALYLGENDDFRVLYRKLGQTTWDQGTEDIAAALDLVSYPLTPSPRHSLDVGAMQRLFRRLDTSGHLNRFQQQIYGIAELPFMVYLELLTWEDRPAAGTAKDIDPTFLGTLAESETAFLTRQLLAAFPKKRGVYLRRVTQSAFSDILVVNPACLAPAE